VTRIMAVGLLAILAVAAGCSSWSKTRVLAQPDPSKDIPGMIRVHLADGRKLTLEHANIVGDSLVGDLREPSRRGHEPSGKRRVAVALMDIEAVDKNRINVPLTLLNLAILTAIAWGLLALGTQDATF